MKVWTWGNGKQGRLGHGNNNSKYLPSIVSFPFSSSSSSSPSFNHAYVSCGVYHSMVAFWNDGNKRRKRESEEGILYAFGSGHSPQSITIDGNDFVYLIIFYNNFLLFLHIIVII